jgi:hypothetical protein
MALQQLSTCNYVAMTDWVVYVISVPVSYSLEGVVGKPTAFMCGYCRYGKDSLLMQA